jgi:hypothetical protein
MIWRSIPAALAGLAGGALLAVFLVFGPVELGGIGVGPWKSNALIGATDAGPVTRAIIARRGLLALNRSETVYFTAWKDGNGDTLRENCRYRVSGQDMPTRWWSLTLYGEDDFLPVNGDNAHALTETDLGSESWSFIAGPEAAPDSHWLSTRNAGDFSITLRLYHPERVVLDDPDSLDLPAIERLGCGEDA